MKRTGCLVPLFVFLIVTGCSKEPQAPAEAKEATAADITGPPVTEVLEARITAADEEAWNWLSHGRTYDEQRFSPLDDINVDTVAKLGLAWYFDVPTKRGMEATPIVVDGRMYVTGAWSIVYALDASTGDELWRYDPEAPRSWAQSAC